MKLHKFPNNFLWGSGTSAVQTEGDCSNHDFYKWAKLGHILDKSNPINIVHFWKNHKKYINLMKQLNHNSARISVEWARIEPKENIFDKRVINKYRNIIDEMLENNITPILTLHHYSNPIWFSDKGGWLKKENIECFTKYVEKIISEYGNKIGYWITINEPSVYAAFAYGLGTFPPGEKSIFKPFKVVKNLATAHIKVYNIIHEIYKKNKWRKPKVGVANLFRIYDPKNDKSILDNFAANVFNKYTNDYFFDLITKDKVTFDIFCINYYTGNLISFPAKIQNRDVPKNSLGFDIYPEGLKRVINKYWTKYKLPILITENGFCEPRDKLRSQYILDHLKILHDCIKEKINVIGYIYWSTMDNIELVEGTKHRFGLIHVDHHKKSNNLHIKESGKLFAQIAKENGIESK